MTDAGGIPYCGGGPYCMEDCTDIAMLDGGGISIAGSGVTTSGSSGRTAGGSAGGSGGASCVSLEDIGSSTTNWIEEEMTAIALLAGLLEGGGSELSDDED